jgi:hypothetical protein
VLKKLIEEFGLLISNLSERLRQMQLADLENGVLDRHLYIDTEPAPLRSPFVQGNRIHFSETFLNFHWCVCFYLCTTTEVLVEKDSDPDFHGELELEGLVDEAHKMINWALNLRFRFIPWPTEISDPYADTPNHNFARLVFKYSLAFILFHEYAHRKLKHVPTDDNQIRIMQETEADNFALETVYSELSDDDVRTLYILGVACTGFSMLYTVSSPAGVRQTQHPDIDVRLFNHLEFFRLEDSNIAHYVHRLMTVGFYGFIHTYNLSFDRDISFSDSWEHVLYLARIVENAKYGT